MINSIKRLLILAGTKGRNFLWSILFAKSLLFDGEFY